MTLLPIFIFIQIIEIPALIVLGLWFVMQFYGAATLAMTPGPEESPGGRMSADSSSG